MGNIKKRILSAAVSACLLFGSAAALPKSVVTESTGIKASSYTSSSGLFEYYTINDTAVITRYNGNDNVITIPSLLDGKKVTRIDSGVFSGYLNLTSITIPNGVTSIGYSSFDNCKSLTSIVIPSSVKTVEDYAFCGCTNLKNIVIQNGVKSIGNKFFLDCTSIISVNIPKSVTSIGDSAFDNCKSLKSLTIQNGVKSLGWSVFNSCTSLKSVTIPSSVTCISTSAFSNCTKLITVIIQNNVTCIDDWAFYGCTRLTNVTIPSSVKRIGSLAFFGCSNIKSIIIPNGVADIGSSAFNECTSLSDVTIPSTVKKVGNTAFYNCTNLKSVTLQYGVESIGKWAFEDCKNLKSVVIPNSVKTIETYALGYYIDNQTTLAKIIIGFKIYGESETAAEKYAKENGFMFVAFPNTVRYAGSDRAETATLIANALKGGNTKTSDTVIIATGFDFHDALAAVPLASAYNAPLLLADRDNLSAKTLAKIKSLKPKNIIVVATTTAKDQNGYDAAIRSKVYKQLSGYKVTKLTGASYYETAKKVAAQMQTKTKKAPTSVFITTDKNYADALSASPVAAILGAPIIYVKPTGSLDSNTKNYLSSIKKSVKNIYIVGGVNAVSTSVEKSVLSVLGKKTATRFAGSDRYETCIKINKTFAKTLTAKSVCIAKGYNFPDALAGGVFAAQQKAPLFLADKLDNNATISKTQASYLKTKNANKLYIFGGETAIPAALVKTIAKASV